MQDDKIERITKMVAMLMGEDKGKKTEYPEDKPMCEYCDDEGCHECEMSDDEEKDGEGEKEDMKKGYAENQINSIIPNSSVKKNNYDDEQDGKKAKYLFGKKKKITGTNHG